MLTRCVCHVLLSFSLLPVRFASAQSLSPEPVAAGVVEVDATHQVNTFVPRQALGAGIDRLPAGAIDKLIQPSTVSKVLSAGWQPVSYRQNTELYIEAWHWNPKGSWSDSGGKGYFTGSAELGEPIRHSYGYLLPHRGFTRNDGADSGYSRLTDGSEESYWKSNPYLAKAFTGEDDTLHPQWVILDLASNQMVDTIRIAWAEPHATRYAVQYWTGDDPIKHATRGTWVAFAFGVINNSKGGIETLRLAASPMPVRFIRVWMTESSNTCDTHGPGDRRNCVGYAIRELYLGTSSARGEFHDLIRHTPDQDQTTTYCSSIDPWHEPSDLDPRMRDQIGFDLFFTSGYTRGLPAMVPIAMLYDVPENAANEVSYLKQRGYPVSYIEMGEEPDGQFMLPEDYGALYLQWASALHRADPTAKLGGPVFQGVNEDIEVWPDAQGRVSWLGRFLDYLKAHKRLDDLAFFSFEHYPLEPCKIQWSALYDEPRLISHIVQVWKTDGVPENTPMIISESNIAWQSAENAPDIFGGLWLADYIGSFLSAGGSGVYYFHYMPLGLHRGCNGSYGTFSLFSADKDLQLQQPLSQYFASQLINLEWVMPGDQMHRVYPALSNVSDSANNSLVTAYALLRPDKKWSVMLINKDQQNAHAVRLAFKLGGHTSHLSGPVTTISFGSEQYQWYPRDEAGTADPDGPPVSLIVEGSAQTLYLLPKASITVIRGNLGDSGRNQD